MNLIDLAMAKALAGGSGGATNNVVQFAVFGISGDDAESAVPLKGGIPTRDGKVEEAYSWIIPPANFNAPFIPLFESNGMFLPF